MCCTVGSRAALLGALLGLLSVATRAGAVACPSTCTQQLKECKQTCAGGGQARRACIERCGERSTCTAPGARIRTLAYVVTECTSDPQGLTSLQQKLLIRRGNCDPVTVMEVATPSPVPALGLCPVLGVRRIGYVSTVAGVFQHLTVLPDGSGVIFEVTNAFSVFPALWPELPKEGIFFVRADGSGFRPLGPASRVPTFSWRSPASFVIVATVSPVSPNGRTMAIVDLGRSDDPDGHEAPQIFRLDLPSGRRTQLTHRSQLTSGPRPDGLLFPSIWLPTFVGNRTIGFYSGNYVVTQEAFQVKTDGSDYKKIPPLTLEGSGAIVPRFEVTGRHPHAIFTIFPAQAENGGLVRELVLVDGERLLQLTKFDRNDTGQGNGFIARDRVFFMASADPLGENPDGICQLFSINELGGGLRQVTHLPSNLPSHDCYGTGGACVIDYLGILPDQVTGTVLFSSSCDPTGGNPFGDQIFAMRSDGTRLRQLTATRGMTTDPDGTLHVELPGPFAYPPTFR